MQGTLFKIDVSDDEVEYSKATNNQFAVRYKRHKNIEDSEIQIRVLYQKQPQGICLKTSDGQSIRDGERVAIDQLAEPSSLRTDEDYEGGRLVLRFDITEEHKPAMAWDEVEFTVLFRGDEATSFTRLFGGYPSIHDDYDPETGEFTVL